jgi:hypothetical protein
MARYLLVQVDDNDRAEALRLKLDAVHGIKTIAVFGKPTQFCECEVPAKRTIRGKKYGWWCCPKCSKPKADAIQPTMRNILDRPDMPAQYTMVMLHIREPFSTPEEHYGARVVETKIQQIKENWAKVLRRRKRTRRPRAR